MFDSSGAVTTGPVARVPEVERTRAWIDELAAVDGSGLSDSARIDTLRELERLKSAAAAAQARVTEVFDRSQRAELSARQPVEMVARSVSSQVALARRDSPARGQRHLGLALALVREMPHTLAALTTGRLSEWRATLIVQATACLSREDRARVDAELAARAGGFDGLGDKRIGDLARGIADRLDPGAAMRRSRRAESGRRVSLRPAPDTMGHLSALVPVAQGVAAYAALRRHAESLRAAGDPRTAAQIMADSLVARVTGRETASGQDVELQLVMNERTLVRGDHEPAFLPGCGPVPAALARRLVREADKVWLRRLFTAPETGELLHVDARRRRLSGRRRDLVVRRDQTCRTPWCDAPIRHVDHVLRWADGGATTLVNSQGLCEACNYAKEGAGWRADVLHIPRHVIELTTPTGHRYRSKAPPQPGADPPHDLERHFRRILDDSA